MALWTCGWCKGLTQFERIGLPERTSLSSGTWVDIYYSAAYRCTNCQGVTAVHWIPPIDMGAEYDSDGNYMPDPNRVPPSEVIKYPPADTAHQYPNVPIQLAQTAREAWDCFEGGSHRAALMVARSVIEAVAKANDITGRNLETKIENMVKAELLPRRLSVAAHELRSAGNDAAHADLGRVIDENESRTLLTIMDQVLDEVYSAPAEIEGLKQAREERERKAKEDRQRATEDEPPF